MQVTSILFENKFPFFTEIIPNGKMFVCMCVSLSVMSDFATPWNVPGSSFHGIL